jgi:hypothetical protein
LRRGGRAAGAGLRFDNDLLAELRREPFGDEARGQIDVAARREAVNDGDGASGFADRASAGATPKGVTPTAASSATARCRAIVRS